MFLDPGPITFFFLRRDRLAGKEQCANLFPCQAEQTEREREVEGKEEEGESRGRRVFLSSTLSAEPSKLIAGHFMCMLN